MATGEESNSCTNGLVLELRKKHGDTQAFIQELRQVTPESQEKEMAGVSDDAIRMSVERMHKIFRNLQKKRNKAELTEYINSPYSIPKSKSQGTQNEEPNRQVMHEIKVMKKRLAGVEKESGKCKEEKELLESQLQCLEEKNREEVGKVKALCDSLQKTLDETDELGRQQAKTSTSKVRNLNKKLKTREEQIKTHKETIKDLRQKRKDAEEAKHTADRERAAMEETKNAVEEREQETERKIDNLKRKIKSTVDNCRKKIRRMTDKQYKEIGNQEDMTNTLIEMEDTLKQLEKEKQELTELKMLMNEDVITTFQDGKYTNEIREVIMELLSMNVSMRKIDGVIRTVLNKLVGKDVQQLPSSWLKSQLLVEARGLADIQLAEALLREQVTADMGHCLHGDGTSKFHRHYQDFEVTLTNGKTMTLGLVDQARGDTETTFESFMYRVKELAGCIKEGTTEDKIARLIVSLKSTMSDQGPINPSFNRELQSVREDLLPVAIKNWDNLSDLTKSQLSAMSNFYCKMHLIVNLEEEAKKALKTFEEIVVEEGKNKHSFATNEAGAARLVRTACKAFTARGSDEAGIPHLLEAHLATLGLKNEMVTFIGNRVNILCHNATAVYYHRHHIIDLIQSLPNLNQLLRAIVVDAQERAFLAGVRALGIIDKTVTGPFWRLLNTAGFNILSLNEHLLTMRIQLERWSKDASSLLEGEPLFPEEIAEQHKDELYEELFRESADEEFQVMTQQALELVMSSMLILLERQAADQLPGGKYWEPSEQVQAHASNVPTTNILAERDFAILDLLVRQKPSARTLSYEAMVMWLHNGTVKWLESLSPEEKKEKMAHARKSAGDILERYNGRKEAIKRQRQENLIKKQEQKKEKERRDKNKKVTITNKIAKLGGVWRSGTEMDSSLTRLHGDKEKMQALVAQLQFHKTVLRADGNKELFQQSIKKSGKSHVYSLDELRLNLIEVLRINQVEREEREEPELQPALTYRSEEETHGRLAEQKRKLVQKLNAAREKRERSKQKITLLQYLEDPEKLVGQRVQHNCCEEGEPTPVWYSGTVLQITKRKPNTLNTIFKIKYDVGDMWEFPLLKDMQIGDLRIQD